MRPILLAAVLIVSFMALIKDGRILRQAGVLGGCTTVATPIGQEGVWQRCAPGKLRGAPDLRRQGCTVLGTVEGDDDRMWRCPSDLASARGT